LLSPAYLPQVLPDQSQKLTALQKTAIRQTALLALSPLLVLWPFRAFLPQALLVLLLRQAQSVCREYLPQAQSDQLLRQTTLQKTATKQTARLGLLHPLGL
jgi:hypothetical protein